MCSALLTAARTKNGKRCSLERGTIRAPFDGPTNAYEHGRPVRTPQIPSRVGIEIRFAHAVVLLSERTRKRCTWCSNLRQSFRYVSPIGGTQIARGIKSIKIRIVYIVKFYFSNMREKGKDAVEAIRSIEQDSVATHPVRGLKIDNPQMFLPHNVCGEQFPGPPSPV